MMPDYDLDVIDAAFDDFRTAVAPRIAPPSAADVATIASVARRRRRTRATIAVVAVFAVIAVPTVTLALHSGRPTARPGTTPPGGHPSSSQSSGRLPAASCTVATLTLPPAAAGYDIVWAVAMDSTGRYVVASLTSSKNLPGMKTVRWHDGHGSVLPVPVVATTVTAVNAEGTVIGGGGEQEDIGGWVVRGGKYRQLPRIGNDLMTPRAINDTGDIVGGAGGRSGLSDGAVIWPADQPGTVRSIAPSGADARGIDNDGTIVGYAAGSPAVWESGSPQPLPADRGRPAGTAMAIRDGWVVGRIGKVFDAGGKLPTAAIWRLGAGGPTVVTDHDTILYGVASDGTAVGQTGSVGDQPWSPENPDAYQAVIYRDGTLSRLPVPPGEARLGPQASSISADATTIAGFDTDTIFTWRC